MKNRLITAALSTLILSTGFAVSAGAHERGRIGHVTDVWPVYETRVEHRQVAETQCRGNRPSGKKRMHDLVVGSLIGSVIGNEISDTPGFGTLGAVMGWRLAESHHQHKQDCYTVRRPQQYTTRVLSHYAVSIAHRGRIVRLRSQHPYNIGDHVRLGR